MIADPDINYDLAVGFPVGHVVPTSAADKQLLAEMRGDIPSQRFADSRYYKAADKPSKKELFPELQKEVAQKLA
eukprot:12896284-Prorocentrum_lima.AAC.1